MKAEDLMIGDLVRFYDEPRKVDDIRQDKVSVVDSNFIYNYSSYFHISPIPLTEALLAKNGWQEDEENDWRHQYPQGLLVASFYQWGKGMVCSISAVNNADVVGLCDVKYVHELQHVLSALGVKEKFTI